MACEDLLDIALPGCYLARTVIESGLRQPYLGMQGHILIPLLNQESICLLEQWVLLGTCIRMVVATVADALLIESP